MSLQESKSKIKTFFSNFYVELTIAFILISLIIYLFYVFFMKRSSTTPTLSPTVRPGQDKPLPTGGPTVSPGIILTSGSGTVTIPDNAEAVIVEMVGGGGGGAPGSSLSGGGGGGSGAFSRYIIRASSLPKIVNYSIGVGGYKNSNGTSTVFHTYVASGGYGSLNDIGGKGSDIKDKNQTSYDGGNGATSDGVQTIREATNGQTGGNSGGLNESCVNYGAGGAGGGGGGPGGGDGGNCNTNDGNGQNGIGGGGGGGGGLGNPGNGGDGFIRLSFI